jgi:hypothetical protein
MAIKEVTTPKDRAKMAVMKTPPKPLKRPMARDRDTKRNWSGRGTSGDEIADKEYNKTTRAFTTIWPP